MNKKTLRPILAVAVLVATVTVFVWYFSTHPEVISILRTIPPRTILILLGLYIVFMGALVWIQRATLELCDIRLGKKESALLVMYSSVINFFGPLQSGPAFRAAYLKGRHNVSLKKYTLATLLYYLLYAAFSGLLLVSFFIGWWVLPAIILVIIAMPLIRKVRRFRDLDLYKARDLCLATLSQVVILSVIYFVELRSLGLSVSYIQDLMYTGAANFALFVSITPGAIGFRESFLLFSQSLHHISSQAIAVASVIDRGVYILMLLCMAALIFGFHGADLLKVKPVTK